MKQDLISLASRATMLINRKPRLVVLTYHRVGGSNSIHTGHIRHHLEYLSRHFDTIAPAQGLNGRPNRSSAMVTIDDCHHDIYEHIFPAAVSLKVPITICVPTDFFLRNQWLWFDQLAWLMERACVGTVVETGGLQIRIGDTDSVATLKKHLKRLLPPQRDAFIAQLSRQLRLVLPPAPSDGYEPVSQSEMREMLRTGLVEICVHTVTHTIATVLPDATFRQELAQSKAELESFCGREVPSFCYPNGEEGDFDGRTSQAVREAGFKMAFTSIPGNNALAEVDPYTIRRVHAHRLDAVFEKEVSGLGDIQRWLRDATSHSH